MADTSKTLEELRKLPVADRLQLVEDLWDSIAEDSSEEAFSVSPELAEELGRRLSPVVHGSGGSTTEREVS